MKWKLNIRKEIKVAMALIAILFLIGFSEHKQSDFAFNDVIIQLENSGENHFLTEADIQRRIEEVDHDINHSSRDFVNLNSIEAYLEADKHIEDAELYGDLKGNLVVNIKLRRPIARIIPKGAPDAYVAEDGTLMSVSDAYTSRVMLISGAYAGQLTQLESMNETQEGKQFFEMMQMIDGDAFWRAQVAQLEIDQDGKVYILPQVTDQLVEFGEPVDVEDKLNKLKIFYTRILPQRGWNRYDRVNLEYKGQIIAE